MPTLTRPIAPRFASWPLMPTGILDVGQSGRGVVRALANAGRVWTEEYSPDATTSLTFRGFLALAMQYYSQRTIVDVTHPDMETLLGAGGGTPLVQGAQTGPSIITDGWPNSTTVLRGGDVVKFSGINLVFDVVGDVTSNGSGVATVLINPPSAATIADNAPLAVNSTPGTVKFRAVIEALSVPGSGPNRKLQGFALTFRELG